MGSEAGESSAAVIALRANIDRRAFFVRQFTRIVDAGREHDYRLALAIAKFHRDDRIDGIWYPSIADLAFGMNAAISPRAADRTLVAAGCRIIEVLEALTGPTYRVRVVETAKSIDDDGSIVW